MRISKINTIQTNKPVFKSCFRQYIPRSNKNFFGNSVIRTSTNVLREDLSWNDLAKYVISHFNCKNKINTYSLASSDGSEAFSYVVSIMENSLSSANSKFFPVKASDIDKEVLKTAKSGRINVYGIEFAMAARLFGIDLTKYLKGKDVSVMINGDIISESDTISSYTVVPEIKNKVEFKQSDILTELKNLKDEGNSVVLCRNVFPYLSYKYVDEVIKTAKEKLNSGSLFVIGNFDRESRYIDQKLLDNGFFNPLKGELNLNIFEKKE